MPFHVYILSGSSNQLYVGQTSNLSERLRLHLTKDPKAAKFTKDGKGFVLVYQEEHLTRLSAMKRESQLKRWSRDKKDALIQGNMTKLKELSRRKPNIEIDS